MDVQHAGPHGSAPGFAFADAEARSRQSAFRELERRSLVTSVVTVLITMMHRFTPGHTDVSARILSWCLVGTAAFTVARFVLAMQLRRLDPTRLARRVWVIGPIVTQVTAWSLGLTWAMLERGDLGQATFLVATFGLCATGVLVSQSAVPALVLTYIVVLMAPVGVALIAWGRPEMGGLGWGALLFGTMLASYLPRVARERRASLMSLVLLEDRLRALEEARDAALQVSAAKDAFHANLSHEIRTPLNGLMGVVDRLRRTRLDNEQRDALEQLDRCGQSLLLILNDALDAVSIEAGKLKLRAEPFELHTLLVDAVNLFQAQAAAKGLGLRLVRTGEDGSRRCRVVGDAQRIRQVLQNLVGNAVKLTDAGEVVVEGHIESLQDAGVLLRVAVRDTGPGFEAHDGPRLFERFSQLHAGKTRGGTGLGLAISRELVEAMGGEISAESRGPGQGARFVVQIPLAVARPSPASSIRGRRVLVVDDNPLNLAVARAHLEGLGCAVERASSGLEAVQLATTATYDAIFMDCQMPGVSGFEAAALIRARGVPTTIIACTAATDAETERNARAAGMQTTVHKPVSSDALEAALEAALDAARATLSGGGQSR